MKAWFRQYYGASNAVVVLAGDVDVETARPLMEKYYGDAPVGDRASRMTEWVPTRAEGRHETIYDPRIRRDHTALQQWLLYGALVEQSQLASSISNLPMSG